MNVTIPARIASVKSKLLSNDTIKVKSDWIEECVKFFIEQSPNIDDETLYQQAMEQWLVADVADASNIVIPTTILQKKESFTLNGTFVLQLQFLIDIAEAPYEQWRRLHNIRLDEVEEIRESRTFQNKKKRVFKLELTDGHKTVYGMEYMPIPMLNSKLSPGTKLKIVGPLQVVNHILLLESRNMVVLGGNVEDLLIVNAYENVLLRSLNKPTTDTPITDYNEEAPSRENNRNGLVQATEAIRRPEPTMVRPAESITNFDDDDDDDVDMETLLQIEEEENKFKRSQEIQQQSRVEEIPVSMELDTFGGESSTRHVNNRSLEVRQTPQRDIRVVKANDLLMMPRSPAIVEVDDENDDEMYLREQLMSLPEYHDEPVPRKIARVKPTQMQSDGADSYKFKSHTGDHLVTINQYLNLTSTERAKRPYVVFGKVKDAAMNKLKIENSEWHLEVHITDSFSHQVLTVKFPNEIVEKIAGYTGKEMKKMRIDAKSRPQLKDSMKTIFNGLRIELQALECFMKIQSVFNPPDLSSHRLLELLEENDETTSNFEKKLKEENLQKV